MGFSETKPGNGIIKGKTNDTALTLESKPSQNPAVQVINACKGYGSSQILQNYCMTVERGTIYGLLGASGCGKTTILSCIVGLKNLDKGEIFVYGARPGTRESGIPGKTTGYMPQDIALYETFSIQEILLYFGRIYGMTVIEIRARMEFLISFLDLPPCDRLIQTLSGGQQRRTSLAVAMIHTPEMLILDEPTVGVDPLIRENIWEYLVDLVSKRRTTCIITTHYIEEARQANTVGLMRNGRLLTESQPQALLEEHQTNLLEDIVLKLCKKDNTDIIQSSNMSDEISQVLKETSFYTRKRRSSPTMEEERDKDGAVIGLKYKTRSPDDDTLFFPRKNRNQLRRQSVVERMNRGSWNRINKVRSLVFRNFLTLFRHPVFVICLLAIPTFQVALFNYIVGKDPINTNFAVVNKEFENTNFLENCQQRNNGCLHDGISCNFFNQFPDSQMNWQIFSSDDEALRSVERGDSWGVLSFPTNFTENMRQRAVDKNFVSNETMDGSTLISRLDVSNPIKSAYIGGQFLEKYQGFIKSILSDCGGDPKTGELPLKFNAIYGSVNVTSTDSMQPPQVLLIIFLLPMAVSVTYIWDKKAGTLDRTMIAGVEYYQVILSLLFSEGCMIILELALCFSVLIFFFNFTIQGSVILCFTLCFLMGICGLSFGFLFGTLCNQELEVLICTLALYLPSLTACGGTWPIEGTPHWAQMIIKCMPLTLGVESIRSIVSRGWPLFHPHVWPGFAVIIGWTIFCCITSGIVHRMRK